MKSLLLTAFDTFAHYTMNPSWEVVQALPETINNYHIHKLRLPNIFGLAPRLLLEEAQRVQPNVILMTGMNSGTTKIDINLAALNIKDALAYAGTTTKVGFVHVPLLPEMVFDESLARPLDETGAIVKAIIECL